MPWITTRRLNHLQAIADMYAENARGAWKAQRSAITNAAKIAERFVSADERTRAVEKRLDRVLRACAGYRATIRKRDQRIRALEARLDDLLGLNQQGVRDGAMWQERRTDKPKQVAP
ncbi:hypothetical protein [Streptomyces sp. NBC_00829]|uniref:hypothetical protein n=1 Tax=Streptomyces sp. NBC_00829 TaxID=2903679 RepID=UPI003867EBBE|nr:hypothetical protein OG293_23335 [Streptomyces sp. NBC_00829]